MALINPASTDLIPEYLNLHSTLPTQVACEKSKYQIYYPKNPIEKGGPISFKVVSGDNDCIDAFNTVLYMATQIVEPDGSPIAEKLPDGVTDNPNRFALFVNGIGTSMIQIVDVKLNDKRISSNDNNYAHRADMENRLSYSIEVKDNSLTMTGFESEETPFDSIPAADLHFDDGEAPDEALKLRWGKVKHSKRIQTISRIHTEICDQPKYLPANSVLDFTFHPNESAFVILTKHEKKFLAKIVDARLIVRHVKIHPTIGRQMEDVTVKGEKMKYPVRRVEVTYYTKGAGMADLSQPGIIHGKKPRRLFFGMIELDAFHGSYKKDPFNYQHFKAKEVSIRVDGERYPDEAMKMNFNELDTVMPLFNLLSTTDSFLGVKDIGINLTNYHVRNTIFAFDLTPTSTTAWENFELTSNAIIDIQILLAEPTTESVAVVIYAEYDAEILVDENRIVEYNQ